MTHEEALARLRRHEADLTKVDERNIILFGLTIRAGRFGSPGRSSARGFFLAVNRCAGASFPCRSIAWV